MKFQSYETDEIFDTIDDAFDDFCKSGCEGKGIGKCPFFARKQSIFRLLNIVAPDQAARIMGYEPLNDRDFGLTQTEQTAEEKNKMRMNKLFGYGFNGENSFKVNWGEEDDDG